VAADLLRRQYHRCRATTGDRPFHEAPSIRDAFLTHLPARGFHPEPVFTVAELVNDAGVVGAADLARIHAAAHGRAE